MLWKLFNFSHQLKKFHIHLFFKEEDMTKVNDTVNSTNRRFTLNLIIASTLSPIASNLFAQSSQAEIVDYPSRPIRIILVGSAGGSTDVVTRLVTQKITELWHQPFLVENLTGGTGIIASEAVARSVPNGYTLYAVSSSTVINSAVDQKTVRTYNFRTSFIPITMMVVQPYVLVVNVSVPVTTVKELITYAKSKPGQLNYGSLGIGSATHIGTELFKSMAGIDMVHVPYKGTNQVESDLVAGHIQVLFGGALSSMPLVKSGKTRALAVTSIKRSKLLPDLPTISESGLTGFDLTAWFGLMAPAGTPQEIIQKIFIAASRVLNTPEVRDQLAAGGSETNVSESSASFGIFINSEIDKWGKFGKNNAVSF